MTAYTLIIIWLLGSNTGQNINVPGFRTLQECREAAALILTNARVIGPGGGYPSSYCLEVMR